MKSSSMNTHMGNIVVDNDVIAQYAGSVAIECIGIVGMAGISVKDGIAKLILDFHVIVAYGVSIMTVSDNLIESVKYKVEEFTGLDVEKINIFVEGVRVID